jgi:hypothetical protein
MPSYQAQRLRRERVGVILATVPLTSAGLVFTAFGLVGVAKYWANRYGRFSRDASGLPTQPLQRGWYKADRLLAPPLIVVGCVGVVLLIVDAVKYLIQA